MPWSELTLTDFAALFGTTVDDLDDSCAELMQSLDLRYQNLSQAERDEVILTLLKKIDAADLPVSGAGRQDNWDSCWAENLEEFIASGYDINKLVPKYFYKNGPVRFHGNYIKPFDTNFVLNCTAVFRNWLFRKYFVDAKSICEFGCGPASHLAFLGKLYPDKRLYGLDWAKSSQDIIRVMAEHLGIQVKGYKFDFFAPDENIHLEKGSRIFTFGALEQIGERHRPFIDFLLRESPDLCINVECVSELYDVNSLPDYLALRYHKKRNYLTGYLTRLRNLEQEGRLKIIKTHHQMLSDMFHDAHSYVIWKPL